MMKNGERKEDQVFNMLLIVFRKTRVFGSPKKQNSACGRILDNYFSVA